MNNTYRQFVFFTAGSLGDHAIELDHANRFFESTGKSSIIIYKNNYSFLKDLAKPYQEHIFPINFLSLRGKFDLVHLFFTSIYTKRCFILWMPIRYPLYMRLFAYFIRFLTVSRFVGLDLDYKSPYGDFSQQSSLYFLGKHNLIPLKSHTELFYEQGNRLLTYLGCAPVERKPLVKHIDHPEFLERNNLIQGQYLAFHLVASSSDRSLPIRRWKELLRKISAEYPHLPLVFTGSKKDISFIKEAATYVPQGMIRIVAGETSMQEMLTLYYHAACSVTIHTGNAMLINMLQVKSVVINMVGNYMFQYHFNPNAIVLFEKARCGCKEHGIDCYIVENGKNYMKCMYDISDEKIIASIGKQLS